MRIPKKSNLVFTIEALGPIAILIVQFFTPKEIHEVFLSNEIKLPPLVPLQDVSVLQEKFLFLINTGETERIKLILEQFISLAVKKNDRWKGDFLSVMNECLARCFSQLRYHVSWGTYSVTPFSQHRLDTLRAHAAFIKRRNKRKSAEKSVTAETQSLSLKSRKQKGDEKSFDVFISHASEDKEPYVRKLATALSEAGLNVWYDNFQLEWGDSLRQSIEKGLVSSKYGIVVLSKAFLKKKIWTERELDGLLATENKDRKIILPIWHDVTREDVLAYSPFLADKLAKRSGTDEIATIIQELKRLTKNAD